ncbi:phosphatidylinositol 3-kinase, root isoform-like [Miscanthus floridulus]|uniref:phosphatidylinositol 3-kinase, root isoform-like n=1 Tax=Miscanthus floridulus TaxID=154761 RepID=UPI00345A1F13
MAGSINQHEFRFFLSCDISLPVTFRVVQADHIVFTEEKAPELFVECKLYIDDMPFGLPAKTRLQCSGPPHHWDELITITTKYRDLTSHSQLAFTVWDVSSGDSDIVGGATISIFNSKRQLRTGKHKLRLWTKKEADGRVVTTTPGKIPKNERSEMERLDRLVNKYEKGQIQHVDWLDHLTFNAAELLANKEKECKRNGSLYPSLVVDFCNFAQSDYRVVLQESGATSHLPTAVPSTNELVTVWDPELGRTNPSEQKQLKLARSLTRGIVNRHLKPSSNELKLLQKIVKFPPTRSLLLEEKQLVWKFRFSLMYDKKALTKFVRSVDWSDIQDSKQAVELIGKWETIDVADALELLSPDFKREEIRAYAVRVLERADDDELQCYLLQLVQALRFETSDMSSLALFLVNRALSNIEIASFLRWYVIVECHDPACTRRYCSTYDMLENSMMKLSAEKDGDDGFLLWQSLHGQTKLASQLGSIMKDVRNVHSSSQKKIEKLRQSLLEVFNEPTNFDEPIRSPLAPNVLLTGIVPQRSSVFKSTLHPLRLTFKTENGGTSMIIFKKGDDLRLDQLVIQMVSLMDRLLKFENLDLNLTPYRVLATGQDEGMIEFIPSRSLAQIISEHRSITSYLQNLHPDKDGPYGIRAHCLETFIKSCAGYSVITYIMGVGDRHLDNILLTDDGHLFHIDFAFIMGRDPKPFPPPMKLCKEMVEAMGGVESQYYMRFKSYCCEAYNILRKSNSLILNLFKLMGGSNIPCISSVDSAGPKGIGQLEQKFRMDLDDEDAIHFFQDLINESVSALFPQMVETIHRWAQYWR